MNTTQQERLDIYKAVKCVRNGEDKITVFDEFREKIKPQLLAQQFSLIPDYDLGKKYDTANKILTLVLSIQTLAGIILNFISMSSSGVTVKGLTSFAAGLLLGAMFIYLIYQKNALMYRLISFFFLINLIILSTGYNLLSPVVISFFFIEAGILTFSLILGFKMFPYFGIFKPKKKIHGIPIYTTKQMDYAEPANKITKEKNEL